MRRICFWIIALIAIPSARADDPIGFNRDVRAILSDKCFLCHGPDPKKREADLRLDQRDSAIQSGAIVPGSPDDSQLMARITSDDPDVRMPPEATKFDKLTPSEVETIRQWIQQGAAYEDHWSFIPIKAPKAAPASIHPIDQMIQASLAKKGLSQQPEADRSTLIRRVTLDLTGLPPTPDEVADFLKDESPQAYEKVVDRLLASSHYGEKMAVDWLDIARYADSYGFQVDRERDVWPWRDWVIQAFNDNLPFDQFVTWQLAGDLLPNATREQILATAFNRLHQQESEGGSVEEEYRVEYVSDRVQTFATAFLGLTFECARCHDHKYDPVTQRDYYQLFAMFHNIDEAGLYSYFTMSPPTPTLWLTDAVTQEKLDQLDRQIETDRSRLDELEQSRKADYKKFLDDWKVASQEERRQRMKQAVSAESRKELGQFSMDSLDGDKLGNSVRADQPALLRGENKLVSGRAGNAVEFTGDDPVDLPIGNFGRHEPFSISLWIKAANLADSPDSKEISTERAVIFHRSRAWTDAASRGYELLIVDGKLQWSLIHFWPGNAISIATKQKLQADTWKHVTVTYDGSSTAGGLQIFVDGELAETEIVRDHLNKEITGGGGDNLALGERFRDRGFKRGAIDEFRVFGRRLTSLEIAEIFRGSLEDVGDWWSAPNEPSEAGYETYLHCVDKVWQEQLGRLQESRAAHHRVADPVVEIMAMRELGWRKPAFVLQRGEYDKRMEEVGPGTPEFLGPMPDGLPKNRLGLAKWLTDPQHPLMARVTVNRLWHSLFGRGLVKTTEDFGSQGSRPLYPEVLDHLAWEWIQSGWDVKQLMKSMVMSHTYRQKSVAELRWMEDDPENEWLARGPRFRLPAEVIRDQVLAVSGLLDRRMGGPPVNPYEMSEAFKPVGPSGDGGVFRRSIYTQWRRTSPPPAMLAFDAPRRAVCTSKRERTDSPLQALILLNGVQYVEAARVLAESLLARHGGNVEAMIDEGMWLTQSRPADAKEKEILKQLYEEQRRHYASNDGQAEGLIAIGSKPRNASLTATDLAAATVLVQALLNHDASVVKR